MSAKVDKLYKKCPKIIRWNLYMKDIFWKKILCMGSDSFLADELYRLTFREKIEIDRTKWRQERNYSVIKAYEKPDKMVFPENKALWTETEIDFLIGKI